MTMNRGRPTSDHYNGNPNVKRDGVVQDYTQHEINEFAKCMKSASYFAENYCQVIHIDKGLVPFRLYPYQKKMFDHFQQNRFNIVLACRQSGKSISSVAYLLWHALFQADQTIAILANKGDTAKEMLHRITLMLENLPFYLQPGCKALNKTSIEFSNNSRILASATSGSSIRGKSCSLIYLDEFAFVEKATQFYTSTYPVISSGKNSKIIITSTANGIGNMFHKLWEGAVQKTNEYKPFSVDWWDVPGRDEQWKAETIANTSQLQFDQEYGNTFYGVGATLIEGQKLLGLRAQDPLYIEDAGGLVYKNPVKGNQYVMTVDVSKGVGGDYSTFSIFDVTTTPFEQVATYRNNQISPLLFPTIIAKYGNAYNNALVVVENNDQGVLVTQGLFNELEYENLYIGGDPKRVDGLGVTMNKKVKRLGCSGIKGIIEADKLIINDLETIKELSTFVQSGTSYAASEGNHDDMAMNLVMLGYFSTLRYFEDLTDKNITELLYSDDAKEINDNPLPFFFDDGSTEIQRLENNTSDDPWNFKWAHDYNEW